MTHVKPPVPQSAALASACKHDLAFLLQRGGENSTATNGGNGTAVHAHPDPLAHKYISAPGAI